MCPCCDGDAPSNCPCCKGKNGGLMTEEEFYECLPVCVGEENLAKSFTTASLLTRDFQKSAGYQNYIAKGGPGSGRRKGDGGGRANQHTGRLVNTAEKNPDGTKVRVGWKTKLKDHSAKFEQTFKAGKSVMREADKLRTAAEKSKDASERQSLYGQASAKYASAKDLLMKAQGFAHSVAGLHKQFSDEGHKDASADAAREWREEKAATARSMAYGAKHLAEECASKAGLPTASSN